MKDSNLLAVVLIIAMSFIASWTALHMEPNTPATIVATTEKENR